MNEIYALLLSTIGLSIKDGKLFDDDKMVLLLYKDKYIVVEDLPLLRNNSIIFDLLGNRGLSQYLFNVYITKEQEEQSLYLISYQIVYESNDKTKINRRKLLIILDGSTVETQYYYNESLVYIEAIFKLSGAFACPDLTQYDNKEVLLK